MVKTAPSKLVKAQSELRAKETALSQAVEAYHVEQTRPLRQRRGYRPIAAEFSIQRDMLHRAVKGRRSHLQRTREDGKLLPEEEEQLVRWIEGLMDRLQPPTNGKITDMVMRIYHSHVPEATELG